MKYHKLYEEYRHDKQSLILERSIEVGDNLVQKLDKINSTLSKKIKDFLNSGDIKDDVKVTKIDFDDVDNKVFTLTDEKGGERKFKFGKLLKYLGFSDEIKGYEIENFISNFKKADVSNLKLIKGDDILKSYLCDNYDDSTGHGNLFNSCMRFSTAQDYLEIYTKNPDQVVCLTLVNPKNKKVQGRALIWKLDNGSYFMDRIYVVNKELESIFNKYAHENNINQGSPGDDITLKNSGEYDYYPYMDMFQYYTPVTGVLSVDRGDLSLTSTSGGGGSGTLVWSEFMQEEIEVDEAVYSHKMDSYIYEHDAVQIFSSHETRYTIDYHVKGEEIHEISYKSDKYEMFDYAHGDDLLELEYSTEHVLEIDTDIYSNNEWGVYLKGDAFGIIRGYDFDLNLYSIEVTWSDSEYYGDYVPYDECCSAWNEEENKFVILLESVFHHDYSEEEFEDIGSWDVQKFTENVYVPEKYLSDSKIIKDNAPFYIDLISREYHIKDEKEDVKLHKGIYLTKDLVTKKCINLDTGYRILPSMYDTNYDDYDDYIKSIRNSIESAKQNHTDSKNYLVGHKYFITAFQKGQHLEKNLLKVLKDKASYTLEDYRNPTFINKNKQEISEKGEYLYKFINSNNGNNTGAFPWKSDIMPDVKYVSWLSYYKNDKIMVFPYVYSIEEDKFLVYRGDTNVEKELSKYRLYSANEVMNLIQYGSI